MERPRLDLVAAPAGARDLVLLAHGGQERSAADPHRWRAPILRMWPFARAAARAAPSAAVGLLRYRYRGWNGADAHPVADLRSVLDGCGYERVALVGHSMGGRAVLRCGDHERVAAVLALAPWLPESDPLVELPDRIVVLAHGTRDRITDPALTERYAAKLRAAGNTVAGFAVQSDTHAMLRRHGDWDELVRRFTRRSLGGDTTALDLHTDPGRPADPLPTWTRRRGPAHAIASIARSVLTTHP